MSRLGDPSYDCLGFPVAWAWMEQTFTVPTSGVSALRTWYHVLSQDLLDGAKFDRFEISLNGTVVLRDGNETGTYGCGNPAQSQGWESCSDSRSVVESQTSEVFGSDFDGQIAR